MLAGLCVAGCSTVRTAREAQKATQPKGEENAAVVRSGKVDLSAYGLEKLVAFAMTNRPSIVSKRLAVEDARLALKTLAADAPLISKTPWTSPKLSLSAGHSEANGGSTFGNSDFKTDGSPSAALSLELLVWDFGRNDANTRAQTERVVEAEHALAEEGFTVFSEVSVAYFNFMGARAHLEVARTNETNYADQLAQAQSRLDAGEADKLDVLKARLDWTNARETTVKAENTVATSGANLMRALGVDASRGTAAEAFGTASVGVETMFRGFAPTACGLDEVYDLARTNAPSLRLARAELRAASHDVDYAIADLYPTLSATASFSWTDPYWYWKWGVSGAQSLFQGFRKTTAVERAVVSLRKSAAAVDEAEQGLSANLETALATRDNSVQALESAQASVRSARENLETVREQYKIGDVSRIELSEAIASYSSALGSCITAFYDGQRAEVALVALVGKYPEYHEETVKGVVK